MIPRQPTGDKEYSLKDPPPLRTPFGRLGVIYSKPPSHQGYTKQHHGQVDSLTFCLKNCLKQHLFDELITLIHLKD
jgi:hypothetical protein